MPKRKWCKIRDVARRALRGCDDQECIDGRYYVNVSCNFCGKEKRVAKNVWRRQTNEANGIFTKGRLGTDKPYRGNFYCDRTCFGKFFGRTHGRGAQLRKEKVENS